MLNCEDDSTYKGKIFILHANKITFEFESLHIVLEFHSNEYYSYLSALVGRENKQNNFRRNVFFLRVCKFGIFWHRVELA